MSAISDGYREVRARIWELADGVDGDDERRPVPCCPEWTVKDVCAHLSGVAADALAGRMEGVATDPWTARQVAERADRGLAEVMEEWRGNAPVFEEVIAQLGEAIDPRLVMDVWSHEQDLRHALGRPGGRDGAAADTVVSLAAGFLRGDASIEWIDERGEVRHVGSGPTGISLRAPRFEFVRGRFGRRSAAQVRALGWDGDPQPWIGRFCVFGPARTEIDEG